MKRKTPLFRGVFTCFQYGDSLVFHDVTPKVITKMFNKRRKD